MHTLSADDTFRFVGDFQGLPVTGHHIEIIADSISQMAAYLVPILICGLGGARLAPDDFFLLPVDEGTVLAGVQQQEWVYLDLNTQIDASGYVDSLCSMKVTQFSKSFFFQQRVGFFQCDGSEFLSGLGT